jgi:hypothetical protein
MKPLPAMSPAISHEASTSKVPSISDLTAFARNYGLDEYIQYTRDLGNDPTVPLSVIFQTKLTESGNDPTVPLSVVSQTELTESKAELLSAIIDLGYARDARKSCLEALRRTYIYCIMNDHIEDLPLDLLHTVLCRAPTPRRTYYFWMLAACSSELYGAYGIEEASFTILINLFVPALSSPEAFVTDTKQLSWKRPDDAHDLLRLVKETDPILPPRPEAHASPGPTTPSPSALESLGRDEKTSMPSTRTRLRRFWEIILAWLRRLRREA